MASQPSSGGSSAGQDETSRLASGGLRPGEARIKCTVTEIRVLSIDERSGFSYYKARVVLPKQEVAKLKGLTLTPGMPAEVFFPTGARTILSYLVKPLSDQIERAFREE